LRVYFNQAAEEDFMANINDPATWGHLSKETQATLYKIKELLFNDISHLTKTEPTQEEPDNV